MSRFVRAGLQANGLLLCLSMAAPAMAQSLADPTRPPASQGNGDAMPVATGPVLQFVLIAPGRSEAVISGQTLKLGEKVGDAQIIKITETEVVLRNGKDLQTLRLFPNVEKQPASRGKEDVRK